VRRGSVDPRVFKETADEPVDSSRSLSTRRGVAGRFRDVGKSDLLNEAVLAILGPPPQRQYQSNKAVPAAGSGQRRIRGRQ